MRITAWWHPARGLDLRVVRWELKTRPPWVAVRLPDGSGERVPLCLTDAAGDEQTDKTRTRFTAESLLDLSTLVEGISGRARGSS